MRASHDQKPQDKTAPKKGKKPTLLPERPNLTKSQVEFLSVYTSSPFLPLKEICRHSGTTPSQVAKWKKHSERFREALRTEHVRTQQVTGMTRKHVIHGILQAIDMAKDMRQPGGMISGYREIGRMCGFYEPERREVQFSVSGKQLLEEMKQLPREKLLEIASQQDDDITTYTVVDEQGNEVSYSEDSVDGD